MNDPEETVYVFTDGASRGNPGDAGWGAVMLIDGQTVVERGQSVKEATNNQMELSAVIGALSYLERNDEWDRPVEIFTDSAYVQNGITSWIHNWIPRGWKTAEGKPVQNKELWKDLYDLTKSFTVLWRKVDGHAGVIGNERADDIATAMADDESVDLYSGTYDAYPLKLITDDGHPTKEDTAQTDASEKKSQGGSSQAWYVSWVDGEIETHQSWKECENRVTGVSSARFKKVTSKQEEQTTIENWQIDEE